MSFVHHNLLFWFSGCSFDLRQSSHVHAAQLLQLVLFAIFFANVVVEAV
jgi:hypothetical protein